MEKTIAHGGFVSYRSNGDGTQSPYELNITWYSALNMEGNGEPQALQVQRFLAARAIALALRGVPGIYLPTLFGARNDTESVLQGAEKRSINRRTYDEASLMRLLDDRECWVSQVARGMRRLIRRRIAQPAFHPNASQVVLDAGPEVFVLLRERPGVQRLLALTNVTNKRVRVRVRLDEVGSTPWRDVLGPGRYLASDGVLSVALPPYGVAWLSAT